MSVVLLPTSSVSTTRDFSSVSAYADAMEIHFFNGEGSRKSTEMIPLELPRQDVGNRRNEMPSALGRFFSQGDFSHGSGQPYYDYESSDEAKFLHSEGFDISEPGLLSHLNAVITAHGGALTQGRSAQAGGKLFVAAGNSIRIYDPITGTSTTVDPHAGEVAVAVQDVTAEGTRVFAALGTNGIHVSSDFGVTWSHYSDAQAIRVSWLKERLIACSALNFYEITAGGVAPSPIETLPTGWTFTDLGENGPYIYAPAIAETAGLSKVFHFGLDNALAVAVQGSSWLPNNELCYSFKGYLEIAFLGCGRVNASGGKDALFYKATPNSDGFLQIDLIAESEGAGTDDLAVRALATKGRNILLGWTLGADSPYGVREGLAIYDLAFGSFATHLASSTSTTTPESVLSCGIFEGRVYLVTEDGVYYEDTTKKVAQASLISSISNFNNPGPKNWDESRLATRNLPNTASVDFQYSLVHPEEGTWSLAGSHTIPDATKVTFRHANTESARFTVKLVSNATTSRTEAPQIETFSVRANPTVEDTEYRLIRTIHFLGTIAKGSRGAVKRYNPVEQRDAFRALENQWLDWHEPDASYNVRLVQTQEIASTIAHSTTQGDPRRFEFVVIGVFEGRLI